MHFSQCSLQNFNCLLFTILIFLFALLTTHGSKALKCNKCRNSELCDRFEDQQCKANRDVPSHPPHETTVTSINNETGTFQNATKTQEVDLDTDKDGCMFAHSGKGEILSGCTEGPNHECLHGALGGDYHPTCLRFNATQLKHYNECITKKKCKGPLCSPQESLAFCFCNSDLCNEKVLLHKIGDTHDSSGMGIKGDMWLCLLVALWTFLFLLLLGP